MRTSFLLASLALAAGACTLSVAGTGPADGAGSGGATTTTGAAGDGGSGAAGGAGGAGGTGSAGGAGGDGGAAGAGGSPPDPVCGDSVISAPETCDDSNMADGDGCSAACAIEPGYECSGEPSACTEIPPIVVTVDPTDDVIAQANGYDGSLQSMGCIDVLVGPTEYTSIQRVELEIALECIFIGDVVIKLVHPSGQITTVLSRPRYDEPADDGGGTDEGDSSDFVRSDPIRFWNGAPYNAEEMGDTIFDNGDVCKDDNRCDFHPNPGQGEGMDLADFNTLDPEGTWRVCTGDSDGNLGVNVDAVKLTVLAW